MEQLSQVFGENTKVIIPIAIVMILCIAISVIRVISMKKKSQAYTAANPDLAKLYITQKAVQTTEPVTVNMVNGAKPVTFLEGSKTGVYIKPGVNKLSLSYTYTEFGVMKDVSKTYGPVDLNFEAEVNQTYFVSFDRDEVEFKFEEI